MALIINGEKVEDAEIQQEAERLRLEYEKVFATMAPAEREAQLLEWSRENVIERVLLAQELKKMGLKISKDESEAVLAGLKKQYKNEQEFYKDLHIDNDQKAKELIELVICSKQKADQIFQSLPRPTQADIKQYYQENKEQFKTDEQVRVAHIVKHVDWRTDEATAYEAIKKAQEELKNGIAFEVVATKYSDCLDDTSDLGYITKGEIIEEFEDVVFNLDVGQTSDIFRTRFGFHIAKVYDRRPGSLLSLEEVKEEIAKKLKEQIREKAIEDFIDNLKNNAQIEEIQTLA